MERKEFIKSSCKACLGLALSGAVISLFEGCATMPVYKVKPVNNVLSIPVAQFAETKMVLARTSQLDYDVLVQKRDDGTYTAIYMRCSHQDQPLNATATNLYCTAHGSTFDLDGNVTKEPANNPLRQFKTTVENQLVNIYIKT